MCYVYSPLGRYPLFQAAVKFVIIPWVALTGVWMWKFKAINSIIRIQEK